MLSFTEAAVTPLEALDYLLNRGVTTWPEFETEQLAALRRGQDYIAREFNGRWASDWIPEGETDPVVPELVKFAIIEAAVVEHLNPGILSPTVKASDAKVLTAVEGIQWTPIAGPSGVDALKPRLLHVESMLKHVLRRASSLLLRY